ncbi:MAG: hypothetical protein RLP44_03710 [Aggregatilineales bacterium]
MKLRLFGVMLVFVVLGSGVVLGQDDGSAFPPDPSEIFPENLEVVDSQMIPPRNQQSFAPEVDTEQRVVRVYDRTNETWRELPYPEGTPPDSHPFLDYRRGSGGDYYLLVRDGGAWLLEDGAFDYVPLEFVCGTQIPALEGYGAWVFVNDETTGQANLCFTETDQRSIPLPEGIVWDHYQSGTPDVSPDDERLVIFGVVLDDRGLMAQSYEAYGYSIADDQLIYLGNIPSISASDYPPSARLGWINDSQGSIFYGPTQRGLSHAFYGFDLDQPESLELIVRGWMNIYDFNPIELRYEYMETTAFLEWQTGTMYQTHEPCRFFAYEARGIFRYDLGYDCPGVDFASAGDFVYTVRVDGNPAQSSTLIRLNIVTGEITEMISGSFEGVLTVTHDNRYILLAVGSDAIDRVDYYDPNEFEMREIGAANLIVFDLQTRERVQAMGSATFWSDVTTYVCGENCFVATLGDSPFVEIPTYIIFPPSGEITSLTTSLFRPSPSGENFIVDYTDYGGGLSVANFNNGTITPLEITQDVYEVSFGWDRTEDIINAYVTLPETETAPSQTALFTLRVP